MSFIETVGGLVDSIPRRCTCSCRRCCATPSSAASSSPKPPFRPNATWPRNRRLAPDGAQGGRRPGQRRPDHPAARRRHLRRLARRKELLQAVVLLEDMISRGRLPHSEWLARSAGSVTPEEALSLGLSPGSQVFRFSACASPTARPWRSNIRPSRPTACRRSKRSRCRSTPRSKRPGNRPVRALQRLRAVAFTPEQAETLGVRAGGRRPVHRTARLPDRRPSGGIHPVVVSRRRLRRGRRTEPNLAGRLSTKAFVDKYEKLSYDAAMKSLIPGYLPVVAPGAGACRRAGGAHPVRHGLRCQTRPRRAVRRHGCTRRLSRRCLGIRRHALDAKISLNLKHGGC